MDIFAQMAATFTDVFGSIYRDAILRTGRRQEIIGGRPTGNITWDHETPVKAMRDETVNAFAGRADIPDTDVKFLVLQAGVPVRPGTDSELEYEGRKYRVLRTMADPVDAYWEVKARPA